MDRLIWLPRILTMCFIAFLTMFGFDVFEGDSPWWEKLIGFLIHSIPSLVLVAILAMSWRLPVAVGWLFVAFAVAMTAVFSRNWNWTAYLVIALPPAVLGALFIAIGTRRSR